MKQSMPRLLRWLGLSLSAASIILGIGILACYIARWDTMSAVTLLPFWVWGIAGAGLSLLAWGLYRRIWHLLLSASWVCVTLFYSDDLSRLILSRVSLPLFSKKPTTGVQLRVISLNCAGLMPAAAEAGSWKPDIVLLQESPSSNDVAALTREWFGEAGDFLVGWDCSIIARGRLIRQSELRITQFTQGRVTLPQGRNVELVSLRLIPPETRLDLWSADCWRAHAHDRLTRKAQMKELVVQLGDFRSDVPYIVGGDFNCPAGDAVSRLLKPRLKDTFREGGMGWGNTGINEIPISRPDQIWVSRDFHTVAVWAVKTLNSDHRMVVCDLVLHP